MKGSASAPSSATMNGTFCVMGPGFEATSRDNRSNLATMTGNLPAFRAAVSAAASWASVLRVGTLTRFNLDELRI